MRVCQHEGGRPVVDEVVPLRWIWAGGYGSNAVDACRFMFLLASTAAADGARYKERRLRATKVMSRTCRTPSAAQLESSSAGNLRSPIIKSCFNLDQAAPVALPSDAASPILTVIPPRTAHWQPHSGLIADSVNG